MNEPFGGEGHDDEADREHDGTDPHVDLSIMLPKMRHLMLQAFRSMECFSQIERVHFTWWIVDVNSGADVAVQKSKHCFQGERVSKICYMDAHTKRRSTERPRLKAKIWPRTSSVTTVVFSIPGGVYWELMAVKKAAGSETATTLY